MCSAHIRTPPPDLMILNRNTKSEFCWRPVFHEAAGYEFYNLILDSLRKLVDIHYPELQPWEILDHDPSNFDFTPIHLQIYRGDKRQPIHFDNGLPWFVDSETGNKWSALALVLSMNDGYATYQHGGPLDGVFESARDTDPDHVVTTLNNMLAGFENNFDESQLQLNRAGQLLGFHPGELAHCGVGSRGYICSLTKFIGRMVMFVTAVPLKFSVSVRTLILFGTERPWGLLEKVHRTQVNKYTLAEYTVVRCIFR